MSTAVQTRLVWRVSVAGIVTAALGVVLAYLGLGLWGFVLASALTAPAVRSVADLAPRREHGVLRHVAGDPPRGAPTRNVPTLDELGRRATPRPIESLPASPPGLSERSLLRAGEVADVLVLFTKTGVNLIALRSEWTRVGRSLAADVQLDDPRVSRRHALIVRQPDGVRALDDRSVNGIYVNGERVEGKTLRDGDVLSVGPYRMVFVSAHTVAEGDDAAERLAAEVLLHSDFSTVP